MNQQKYNKVIGQRITTLRRKQHLNQRELALKIGIPKSEILHFERGGELTLSSEKLCLLADILGIKVSDLLRVD